MAQDRGQGEFWVDHADITVEDLSWLTRAERLTLWNVRVPPGLLAQLDALWWLDIRGGSATDLATAAGCTKLRYLQVNQVRGLHDLDIVTTFASLQLLSLYGLAKVTEVPSLRGLESLRRLVVGQMRSLGSLGGLLDAPGLTELVLIKRVGITDRDVAKIKSHGTLERFGWSTDDVPASVFGPVIASVDLPPARTLHAAEWFASELAVSETSGRVRSRRAHEGKRPARPPPRR